MAERIPLEPLGRQLQRRALRGLWVPALKALFGLSVQGQPPAGGPVVFAGNHGSHYDAWFICAVLFERLGEWPMVVTWAGARRHWLWKRIVAAGAESMILPRDLPDRVQSRAGVALQMIDALEKGRSVLINPEGDRFDRLAEFQPGAALAAWQANVPLVPFSLRGVQPLWPREGLPNRFCGKVSINFHPPIDPAEYRDLPSRAAVLAMTRELRRRVASAIDYPDAFGTSAS